MFGGWVAADLQVRLLMGSDPAGSDGQEKRGDGDENDDESRGNPEQTDICVHAT